MQRSVLALALMGVLAGCSTTATQREAPEADEQSVQYAEEDAQVGVAHYDVALGGAAWRAPGHRHVIGGETPTYSASVASAVDNGQGAGSEAGSSANSSEADESSSKEVSTARNEDGAARSEEAARAQALWRELCDPTTTMTEAEREAFQRLRREYPMPEDLADECAPRK